MKDSIREAKDSVWWNYYSKTSQSLWARLCGVSDVRAMVAPVWSAVSRNAR